jgi:ribosome-binding protein aMBF1 (putative translation factor)
MEHQDFKPVVLRKNKDSQSKSSSHFQSDQKIKLENTEDIVKPKMFSVDFGKKLASLRLQKNMSRKDIAMRLNFKESVISDIENGKLLYDGSIVHKLKRLFPTL